MNRQRPVEGLSEIVSAMGLKVSRGSKESGRSPWLQILPLCLSL